MYNIKDEMEKMTKVFGKSNANALFRNRLLSIGAVKEYIEKYPFEEYEKYHADYYRGIGPVKYNQIIEAINNMERAQ